MSLVVFAARASTADRAPACHRAPEGFHRALHFLCRGGHHFGPRGGVETRRSFAFAPGSTFVLRSLLSTQRHTHRQRCAALHVLLPFFSSFFWCFYSCCSTICFMRRCCCPFLFFLASLLFLRLGAPEGRALSPGGGADRAPAQARAALAPGRCFC